MKRFLIILGVVALLCAPMSLMASEGDLQTLAPLTDEGNVSDGTAIDKAKKYFVITAGNPHGNPHGMPHGNPHGHGMGIYVGK